MIVIGLLFLAAVGVAGAWLYLSTANDTSTQVYDLSAWGMTIGFRPITLLIAGIALTLGLILGLGLIRAGMSRGRRQRRERKELARTAEANRQAAEQAASRRLEQERSQRGSLDIDPMRRAESNTPRPFTGPSDGETSHTAPPPPPRG